MIPKEDQICQCGHWYEEHTGDGCDGCEPGTLRAHLFRFSTENSAPEAVADRGGDPDAWPQHVKDHFAPRGARLHRR